MPTEIKSIVRLIFCFLLVGLQTAVASEFHVSPSGDDNSGDGSSSKPWKTLGHACEEVSPDQGHVIRLSPGVYIERQITVPTGVSIFGAGREQTVIKSHPSFYYFPPDPGFSTDKLLINFSSAQQEPGNQSIRDLTIDGDNKQLHGALFVKNRTDVLIQGITIHHTRFTGIWLWDVSNSRVTDVTLQDCAWGSSKWSAAAILLANLSHVEIDHIRVDEGFGEGVKSLGANGSPANGKIHHLKFHDNRISVTPTGQWKTDSGDAAPNLSFELWNSDLLGCELYNNYFDNTVSLIMDQPQFTTVRGLQTVRIYNNIFDLETRAKGDGYALEISLHDVEIDHNYILKGKWGIVNWDKHGIEMTHWNIHHNVFYGLSHAYPAHVVLSQHTGLHDVRFYNNTVEFVGTKTTNLIGIKGGTSENVEIKNNLIINSNTRYNFYPNRLIQLENGSTIKDLVVSNNLLYNMPAGDVPGKYERNLSQDPKITKSGTRPTSYYMPMAGSPLIDAGLDVGVPFHGKAPDIGAYEFKP